MVGAIGSVPSQRIGNVFRDDKISIDKGSEAIVVAHVQGQARNRIQSGLVGNVEFHPDIAGRAFCAHFGNEIDIEETCVVPGIVFIASGSSAVPGAVVEGFVASVPGSAKIVVERDLNAHGVSFRQESQFSHHGRNAGVGSVGSVKDLASVRTGNCQAGAGSNQAGCQAEDRGFEGGKVACVTILLKNVIGSDGEVVVKQVIPLGGPFLIAVVKRDWGRASYGSDIAAVVAPAGGFCDDRIEHLVLTNFPIVDNRPGSQETAIGEVLVDFVSEEEAVFVVFEKVSPNAGRVLAVV